MSNRPVAMTLCVTAHRTQYLTECLLSVLAQCTSDFNLVLCADSSGDRAVRTVYEQFAPFITVNCLDIVEVRGGTAGIVRNAAFDRARTPWVTYLDGDDILLPSAMSDLLAEIESDEVDIASTGIFRIHEDGRIEEIPWSLRYKPPIWIYQVDPPNFSALGILQSAPRNPPRSLGSV
jgi:glycosyltransferase involved in cell wall biosynthesis